MCERVYTHKKCLSESYLWKAKIKHLKNQLNLNYITKEGERKVDTLISRDKEGKIKVNLNTVWTIYDTFFETCKTKEEIDSVLGQIDMMDKFVGSCKKIKLKEEMLKHEA